MNLHTLYQYYVDQYQKAERGDATVLEPYQRVALESIPCWRTYGLSGPYPTPEVIAFLRTWLAEHDGQPPMLNLHNGGYTGLDATPMERLSGWMTLVNQGDGRDQAGRKPGSGFTVSADRQAVLDALHRDFGLVWRKARGADGVLIPDSPDSWLQASYKAFLAEYKANGATSPYIQTHFPGFPRKHLLQTRLDLVGSSVLPPKRHAAAPKRSGQRPAPAAPPN